MTGPNKSNVVTVTVFGNLYEEKNTSDIRGEASVLLSVLLTVLLTVLLSVLLTFLPVMSPAKNFNSPSVCDENKALQTETLVNFPPENSLHPCQWESDSFQFKKRNFVTFQDVWWVRISITTHYNSINMIINCQQVYIDRRTPGKHTNVIIMTSRHTSSGAAAAFYVNHHR